MAKPTWDTDGPVAMRLHGLVLRASRDQDGVWVLSCDLPDAGRMPAEARGRDLDRAAAGYLRHIERGIAAQLEAVQRALGELDDS